MKDVQRLLGEDKLFFVRCDGCMLGYRDAESGRPYKKPMGFITNMGCAADFFSKLRCDGKHKREPLMGSNAYGRRSTQAAEWPDAVDEMMTQVIEQQMIVDEAKTAMAATAYAARTRRGIEEVEAPLRSHPGSGAGSDSCLPRAVPNPPLLRYLHRLFRMLRYRQTRNGSDARTGARFRTT